MVLSDDPHSWSRPEGVVVRHASLDLLVDFDERRLTGTVRLDLDRPGGAASELVLDSWRLDVLEVTTPEGSPLEFAVGEHDELLGSPVTVAVGDADSVVVRYRTDVAAPALQWLTPEQTASGKPFLFTQSQAIHARSWVPVQDTPGVRFTYDATITVPDGLLALMSAENPTEPAPGGVHRFTMDLPVPAYLMALAVGELAFRPLGERTGVYAEPPTVEAAAFEFAETEQMLTAAERLYGPYRWGRYDLLVCPPSFPFGGMENPRLTFVTPTLLAGDRSLVSVVAHEVAHSWSGNLVTNASWNDFWLNEGFTVYLETRIVEELHGPAYAEMLLQLNRGDLVAELPTLPERNTWLELDLAGQDPDAGISSITYDKGSLFLRMLEQLVGRPRFDEFLNGYFDAFAFTTIDTPTFLAHLRAHLLEPEGIAEDAAATIEAWVHGPGLPDDAPAWTSERLAAVDEQVRRFLDGGSVGEFRTDGWSTHEWIHLVRALPRDRGARVAAEIDAAFGLSSSTNAELLFEWLQYAIDTGHVFASPAADRAVEDFLTRQGRRKFLIPLYGRLAGTPEGRERAAAIYARARSGYHPASTRAIDRILGRG